MSDKVTIQYTRNPRIQIRVTSEWWEREQDVWPHWELVT